MAIMNCMGTPVHVVPDRGLGRACNWFPLRHGRGGVTPGIRRTLKNKARRHGATADGGHIHSSPYLVPVFPSTNGGSASFAGGVGLSLAVHSDGRRIAVGNGTRVMELLMPPALGLGTMPRELALNTPPVLAFQGKAAAANDDEDGGGAMRRTKSEPGQRSKRSQPNAMAAARWSKVRHQARLAAVSSFILQRKDSVDSVSVDTSVWRLQRTPSSLAAPAVVTSSAMPVRITAVCVCVCVCVCMCMCGCLHDSVRTWWHAASRVAAKSARHS